MIKDLAYAGESSVSMKPEVYTVPLDVFLFKRPEDRLPFLNNNYNATSKSQNTDNHFNENEQHENIYKNWSSPDYILK